MDNEPEAHLSILEFCKRVYAARGELHRNYIGAEAERSLHIVVSVEDYAGFRREHREAPTPWGYGYVEMELHEPKVFGIPVRVDKSLPRNVILIRQEIAA